MQTVGVTFLRQARPYNAGETAHFPPEVAARFLAKGVARKAGGEGAAVAEPGGDLQGARHVPEDRLYEMSDVLGIPNPEESDTDSLLVLVRQRAQNVGAIVQNSDKTPFEQAKTSIIPALEVLGFDRSAVDTKTKLRDFQRAVMQIVRELDVDLGAASLEVSVD